MLQYAMPLLQYAEICCSMLKYAVPLLLKYAAVCCSMLLLLKYAVPLLLKYAAVCCSVLQYAVPLLKYAVPLLLNRCLRIDVIGYQEWEGRPSFLL